MRSSPIDVLPCVFSGIMIIPRNCYHNRQITLISATLQGWKKQLPTLCKQEFFVVYELQRKYKAIEQFIFWWMGPIQYLYVGCLYSFMQHIVACWHDWPTISEIVRAAESPNLLFGLKSRENRLFLACIWSKGFWIDDLPIKRAAARGLPFYGTKSQGKLYIFMVALCISSTY